MLAEAVFFQGVEAIARGIAQVFKAARAIEHFELVERAILNVARQPLGAEAVPDAFGVGGGEGADHCAKRPTELEPWPPEPSRVIDTCSKTMTDPTHSRRMKSSRHKLVLTCFTYFIPEPIIIDML